MNKYYYYDFCYSPYYEPDIGITISENKHDVFDGFSIEVKDNESLVNCFKECFTSEFEEYMPSISVGEYNYYLGAYKNADMNDVYKNMELVNQIENRAYELKNHKSLLKKLFGDKVGYGNFYQRFVLLNDYGLLISNHETFKHRIDENLTEKEKKVLFKDDKKYEQEKKEKRIKYLNEQIPKLQNEIKSKTTKLNNVKKELDKLTSKE